MSVKTLRTSCTGRGFITLGTVSVSQLLIRIPRAMCQGVRSPSWSVSSNCPYMKSRRGALDLDAHPTPESGVGPCQRRIVCSPICGNSCIIFSKKIKLRDVRLDMRFLARFSSYLTERARSGPRLGDDVHDREGTLRYWFPGVVGALPNSTLPSPGALLLVRSRVVRSLTSGR